MKVVKIGIVKLELSCGRDRVHLCKYAAPSKEGDIQNKKALRQTFGHFSNLPLQQLHQLGCRLLKHSHELSSFGGPPLFCNDLKCPNQSELMAKNGRKKQIWGSVE